MLLYVILWFMVSTSVKTYSVVRSSKTLLRGPVNDDALKISRSLLEPWVYFCESAFVSAVMVVPVIVMLTRVLCVSGAVLHPSRFRGYARPALSSLFCPHPWTLGNLQPTGCCSHTHLTVTYTWRPMESSVCSHWNSNEMIPTECCTCQDSCCVVACAEFCRDARDPFY